jgi:hypothetical protein
MREDRTVPCVGNPLDYLLGPGRYLKAGPFNEDEGGAGEAKAGIGKIRVRNVEHHLMSPKQLDVGEMLPYLLGQLPPGLVNLI